MVNGTETTYQIFDSGAGKTIVFNNLYFINGEFIFNGTALNSKISTYPNVHYHHTNSELWSPKITELSDEIGEVQLITTPYFYLKETLHYHPGHTLMDDIFSIFNKINRCGLNYNPFVCLLDTTNNDIDFYYDCKGMFELLFGHKAVLLDHFKVAHSAICFKTFVVGNGGSGFSSYDFNYISPFQDGIWKKFRDAFYKRAGIDLDIGNKIIYVNTIKNEDNLEERLINILKENDIDIVCWGEVHDIREQLNILKNVKVYITTDGSASLNTIFLPDNATVINLGRTYAYEDYKAIGYSEDYLFPALPYIDVLYFEDYYDLLINDHGPLPNPNDLMQIIEFVVDGQKETNPLSVERSDIYNKFALKIIDKISYQIKLNNFSPNARLLFEHYLDNKARFDVIDSFRHENTAFGCNDIVRSLKNDALLSKLKINKETMKKIISYSLYNNRPKDVINAIINCFLIPKIYPGWITRFYIDDSLPPCIEQLLRTFEHVEVVVMPRHRGSEAMLWRFLPASEPEYDTVMISRDADSWVSVREKVCVDQWLESKKNFHIIRDHCYHSQKIMGGMWGVRNSILPKMKEMVEEFSRDNTYDQGFLADKIYPNITHDLMVHYGAPQYNNQGQVVNGYFNDGGIPIPAHEEWDEPIPGLSFREVNKLSAFHCAHCKKTHDVLIGGIMEHIPPRAITVVKEYAHQKGIVLDVPGL